MTANAAQKAERIDRRYMFRRRGLMTNGEHTVQIRTLDVSAHGFGIITSDAIAVGKSYSISLHSVVGGRMLQLNFSCKTAYCILTGMEGFRVGLHVDKEIPVHKEQLQKIIAGCPMPLM